MATDPSTASLTAQEQIRQLHEDWFAASHRQDLDDIREECRRGFDLAGDDFMWTVPDLHVVADGDVAVAWSLNRMTDRLPDESESTTWSRGTRVFQRHESRWMMIHQHVSFPFDPATGLAATGPTP